MQAKTIARRMEKYCIKGSDVRAKLKLKNLFAQKWPKCNTYIT